MNLNDWIVIKQRNLYLDGKFIIFINNYKKYLST